VGTSTNNRILEPYTRVDEAHSAIGLVPCSGAGSVLALGGSSDLSFMPTFWLAGDAAPGTTYTARFSLVNLGSNSTVLDSGNFYFDLAVPVPEPQLWLMLAAGLGLLGWMKRRQL
jgi:PEP-CTERM motif